MDNNIKELLVSKNMTQAKLAERVGVKREYMNRIIMGKINPTMPLGMRIAKALGETCEYVYIVD
jgi:putative transcriptional regulator